MWINSMEKIYNLLQALENSNPSLKENIQIIKTEVVNADTEWFEDKMGEEL